MVRFTTKKIATLTLGEKLKNMRSERRLSISEVSKHTKIQAKYLEYIEEGEYSKLPADVYVKGFLRSLGNFMGVNENSLIKQFEREKGIHKNIKKIDDEEKTVKPIRFSKFVITPKLLAVVLIGFSIFSIFFYLYKEVDSFVSKPRLVIIKPVDGTSVDGKNVHVTGVAEKDTLVSINDQPVLVSEKGEFGQDIGLQEGLNTITVKAKNRFDKESVSVVNVNSTYQSPISSEQSGAVSENVVGMQPLNMEIDVTLNPVWLSVEADGNLVYSGNLNPGETKKIEAKEKILVTSSKGNQTFVKLNGKELGALAGESGAVKDVVFTVNGQEAAQAKEPVKEENKKSKK